MRERDFAGRKHSQNQTIKRVQKKKLEWKFENLKIIVDKEFKHEGKKFEAGETVELPDNLAKDVIEKGFAKNAEKIEQELEVKPASQVEPLEEEEDKKSIENSTEEKPSFEKEKTPEIKPAPSKKRGSDVWKELEEKLDEKPPKSPAWRPSDPDDQILGEVIRTGRGPNGRLLEVKTPKGEKYVIWEKVALKDLFDRVDAGDKIGIRFLGEQESSSGRSYFNFRTAIKKKGQI